MLEVPPLHPRGGHIEEGRARSGVPEQDHGRGDREDDRRLRRAHHPQRHEEQHRVRRASLPVTARAVSYEYGAMCAAAVDWDTSGIASIAELTASTNPTELRARFRGQGTLRAYYGGMMATANVIVTGAQPPPNPYRPPDPSLDGGCSCRSATGAFDLGLLVAVAVACRRRRRR